MVEETLLKFSNKISDLVKKKISQSYVFFSPEMEWSYYLFHDV